MVTQERLRYLLTYNPTSGDFYWNVSRGRSSAGTRAGHHEKRYVGIKIDGRLYAAHRLAFLYMTGEFPPQVVDHLNGDTRDNRWNNLRLCSLTQNQHNRKVGAGKEVPFMGVHRNRNKYRSRIMADGQSYYLGTFDTPEEAHEAYLEAKRHLHPTHPVPRNDTISS